MKEVKVGVMGAGEMGRYHSSFLRKIDGVKLVGYYDPRREVAEKAAEEFGGRAFKTLEDLCKAGIEGCVVASPPQCHKDNCVELAEMGVHMLCEKPISMTLEEADDMINAAKRNHVFLMVGQVLRFWEPHPTVKKMLAEDAIGKLLYVETNYAYAYNPDPPKIMGWRKNIGGFLEHGVHKLDLAIWLGGLVKHVKGEAGRLHRVGHEDYVLSILRFENGAVGILKWGPFLGARRDNGTILDGTDGSIVASMAENCIDFKKRGENAWNRITPEKQPPFLEQMKHFIHCLREGKNPEVTGIDGRKAIELGYAIYLSAEKHGRVDLPLRNTPTRPYMHVLVT